MHVERVVSQIINDLTSGLSGLHHNLSINREQIVDEVIQCRLQLMPQALASGLVTLQSLVSKIPCVTVDCKSVSDCNCEDLCLPKVPHFTIPALVSLPQCESGALYIGGLDMKSPFQISTSQVAFDIDRYRRRSNNTVKVMLTTSVERNGWIDGYIYNAPFIRKITVVGVIADPRMLDELGCCDTELESNSITALDQLIHDTIIKNKLQVFRVGNPIPNNQIPSLLSK